MEFDPKQSAQSSVEGKKLNQEILDSLKSMSGTEPSSFWSWSVNPLLAWTLVIFALGGAFSFVGNKRPIHLNPTVKPNSWTAVVPIPKVDPLLSTEDLLERGHRLLREGKWEDARSHFEQAGAKGSSAGWYQAGLICMEGTGPAHRPELAAGYFLRAQAHEGRLLPEVLWKLAWLYEQGEGVPRDPEFSKHLRDEALAFQPGRELSYTSAEFLARLWEDGKTGHRDRVRAAAYYRSAGNSEKALLVMIQAGSEGEPEAMLWLGRDFLMGKEGVEADPEKGVEMLQQLADRGDGRAWFALSKYFEKGKASSQEQAIACLRKATEVPHPPPEALQRWGSVLLKENPPRVTEAFACFERAHTLAPPHAAEEWAEALERGVGGPPDYLRAAELFREAGRTGKARSALLKAVRAKQQGALTALGELHRASGNHESAMAAFQEALKVGEPAEVPLGLILVGLEGGTRRQAHVQRGLAHLQKAYLAGRPGGAISAFRGALRHDALSAPMMNGLAAKLRLEMEGDPLAKLAYAKLMFNDSELESQRLALRMVDEIAGGPAAAFKNAPFDMISILEEFAFLSLNKEKPFCDHARAKRLFRMCVALGRRQSWVGLAKIYQEGLGVEPDRIRADYCTFRYQYFVGGSLSEDRREEGGGEDEAGC